MRKLFLLSILILTSCSSAKSSSNLHLAENTECKVRGNSANWQAAYCMWINSTNDFDNTEVKRCYDLALRHKGIPQDECQRSVYFKTEICKILITEKYYNFNGNLDECLLSEDTTPKVVKEGL